jgi:citrate lyase beta subunit
MKRTLAHSDIHELTAPLAHALEAFSKQYPGESGRRQAVHTVYGGAHLFRSGTARKLGEAARRSLDEFAPNFAVFAQAIGLPSANELPTANSEVESLQAYLVADPDSFRSESRHAWLAHAVYQRVREKLQREPVEDFRIDFEDGYGNRDDEEEDGHAAASAQEVAAGIAARELPPFIGIRIKPFSDELRERSIRTLDIFVTTLSERSGGKLPANFVVTLPKVKLLEEMAALAGVFERLERALHLEAGALRMELMVETTQAIFDAQGASSLLRLVQAAQGRCIAAHFGTYDYTAACGITAAYQTMMHPTCDFARHIMQIALAGTGVWLSDGATNILPVAPHRSEKKDAAQNAATRTGATNADAALTSAQIAQNRAAVHSAWRIHYNDVRHSLINGFYQGWDLHPAQLPTRYAAVYAFFLGSMDAASDRIRNFISQAARATLAGDVFDDAATGQGLLNYFLRALNCGAIREQEILERTSLTPGELRSGSFAKILKDRSDR